MTSEPVRIALAWLGTYAVHSTLLLGGVWGLCLLRPPRAPRSRERLWKLAMVGGIMAVVWMLLSRTM